MKQLSDKKRFCGLLIGIFFLIGCSGGSRNPQNLFKPIGFSFPQPFRDSLFADTLHGAPVPDPYRWMEAEEAPILQEWLLEEGKLAQDYLSRIPFRKAVEQRVRELWNFERQHDFQKQGEFLYFLKNTGLQDHDVLVRQSLDGGAEEPVADPNALSRKARYSLGQFAFSAGQRYLAYERRESGSDWRTIFLHDLVENKPLQDTLRWVRHSQIAWAGEGFYYSRYPAPARGEKTSSPLEFHQVFYHKLGDRQSGDQLVFADRARSKRCFKPETSLDERFLVLNIWETNSGNGIYVLDRQKEGSGFVPIVDDMANRFKFIGSAGDHLLFLTDFEADRGKLIKVSIQKPDPGFWEVVIPEKPDILYDVYLAGDKLVAHYVRDAQHFLQIYENNGAESIILTMQEGGTIHSFHGRPEEDRAFFTFESFLTAPTVYELDMNLLTAKIFKAPKVNFNHSPYETRLVFIKNTGQADVPLFITAKKGMKLDRNRPVLLLGDGSLGRIASPRFDPAFLSLLENDGVLALAVLRGGGEYGRKWHEEGVRSKKQHTFDDFQTAAGYLISQGYTRKEKLAVFGKGPGGGLLTGASIVQRPDLFQVAGAESGLFDMIRYQQFTIGGEWAFDFGRIEEPREFDHLNAFSPLHNVRPGEYPATLLTAGDRDDRVYPAHSYKFAAELQYRQKGPQPVLFLQREGEGNAEARTVTQEIRNRADWLSFMYFHLQQPVVYEIK